MNELKEEIVNKDTLAFLTHIPQNTIELELNAKVYMNGEIIDTQMTLDLEQIRQGLINGEDYEDSHCSYLVLGEE